MSGERGRSALRPLSAGTPRAPGAGGGSPLARSSPAAWSRRQDARRAASPCPCLAAAVSSRRLSSEAALSAAGPGRGAGLAAAAPGERLPTNEGERGRGCGCPGPASQRARTEGPTGSHRLTAEKRLQTCDQRHTPNRRSWTAHRVTDRARRAWAPASSFPWTGSLPV